MRPEHGVLFEPDSVPQLSAALLELTADPARLVQLGAAGERFARTSGFDLAHARRADAGAVSCAHGFAAQ